MSLWGGHWTRENVTFHKKWGLTGSKLHSHCVSDSFLALHSISNWFTSFRIPNVVVCISIALSSGYGFIAVELQVCFLPYKRHLKAVRQDSYLSNAHFSVLHIPAALLVTPYKQFSEALPRSAPPSDWHRVQGSPNTLFSNATVKVEPATAGLYCFRQWRSQRTDALQS